MKEKREKYPIRSIYRIGNTFAISIPTDFIKKLKLEKGDLCVVNCIGEKIIYRPIPKKYFDVCSIYC